MSHQQYLWTSNVNLLGLARTWNPRKCLRWLSSIMLSFKSGFYQCGLWLLLWISQAGGDLRKIIQEQVQACSNALSQTAVGALAHLRTRGDDELLLSSQNCIGGVVLEARRKGEEIRYRFR
ncbi:hypothetical protein J3R82DRAFT_2193 [Butyriboletus roseoflavus]|nr:hypothetical protein J3R82DRAFT_2193 [Butyriboletus roseoflavus]